MDSTVNVLVDGGGNDDRCSCRPRRRKWRKVVVEIEVAFCAMERECLLPPWYLLVYLLECCC